MLKDAIANVNEFVNQEKDELIGQYEAQKSELIKSRDEWQQKFYQSQNETLNLKERNKILQEK